MWRKKKRKRNRTIDYSDLPSTLVYECSVRVKIAKVDRTPRRKSDFDVFQVKDYHEKKYEGGEEEKTTTTDRVEVAKDGLGLILERWGYLFIL